MSCRSWKPLLCFFMLMGEVYHTGNITGARNFNTNTGSYLKMPIRYLFSFVMEAGLPFRRVEVMLLCLCIVLA